MRTLGIDTSNYTTSVAIYDSDSGEILQRKKLLPVKSGERGLRQSDAVFHHTAQLAPLLEELLAEAGTELSALGASEKPRNAVGSYMPCFTVGVNTARCICSVRSLPLFGFSHQCGHIAAALWSAGKYDELSRRKFIAFHVSGGTTEMLLVSPDENDIFDIKIIGKTLDLNAGQAVDRVGLMLSLDFPCGAALERLALQGERVCRPKVFVKNGDCSLSGLENKCAQLLSNGESRENTARFCIDYIAEALDKMTEYALGEYGELPLVYAGGVMSNSIIRERFFDKYGGFFAKPEFSCDNAAGTALMAYGRMRGNG